MNWEDKTAVAQGEVLVELPLEDAAPNFNLGKAVCSHGLFMMAPNHWDSHLKTLKRPLRFDLDNDETSLTVHISHPPHSPQALHLRVFGTRSLSPLQQQSLLSQVRRMLRLSEEENRRVIEFHKVHGESKLRDFGRVFRSPSLFEDMIKCILMCNCQWSRTLSMAQALCELQAELGHPLSTATEMKHFLPKRPARKEPKRPTNLANKYSDILGTEESEMKTNNAEILGADVKEDCDPNLQPLELEGTMIGNFPSPRELANVDEKFLAKCCNLGYRAGRIINLARGVVEGRIHLRELEYGSSTVSLSSYDELAEKLRVIDGFGPFTCANVLMCMGFYHVIPTDSETIRHLKQVHAINSTIQTVKEHIEDVYKKYAPFQFLAYWSEVWHFYEEWFGKLSEMPHADYKLITAANMRTKMKRGSKRIKLSMEDVKI